MDIFGLIRLAFEQFQAGSMQQVSDLFTGIPQIRPKFSAAPLLLLKKSDQFGNYEKDQT